MNSAEFKMLGVGLMRAALDHAMHDKALISVFGKQLPRSSFNPRRAMSDKAALLLSIGGLRPSPTRRQRRAG